MALRTGVLIDTSERSVDAYAVIAAVFGAGIAVIAVDGIVPALAIRRVAGADCAGIAVIAVDLERHAPTVDAELGRAPSGIWA
jgi:hypothetical protein